MTIALKNRMRINGEITVQEVRLIGADGEQVGVMPTQEALQKAEDAGVDLVEISPNARPPVCKITDYGKYLYRVEKKKKDDKKKQKVVEVKEVKFTPKIGQHDFDYRLKRIINFIEKGHKVKVTVYFRGREMAHTDLGFKIANQVLDNVKDIVTVERRPKMEGRNLSLFLVPLKKK